MAPRRIFTLTEIAKRVAPVIKRPPASTARFLRYLRQNEELFPNWVKVSDTDTAAWILDEASTAKAGIWLILSTLGFTVRQLAGASKPRLDPRDRPAAGGINVIGWITNRCLEGKRSWFLAVGCDQSGEVVGSMLASDPGRVVSEFRNYFGDVPVLIRCDLRALFSVLFDEMPGSGE